MKDKKIRSLIKGVSYRILAIIFSVLLIYFLTGSYILAFTFGAFDILLKIFLYYGHERVWNEIK